MRCLLPWIRPGTCWPRCRISSPACSRSSLPAWGWSSPPYSRSVVSFPPWQERPRKTSVGCSIQSSRASMVCGRASLISSARCAMMLTLKSPRNSTRHRPPRCVRVWHRCSVVATSRSTRTLTLPRWNMHWTWWRHSTSTTRPTSISTYTRRSSLTSLTRLSVLTSTLIMALCRLPMLSSQPDSTTTLLMSMLMLIVEVPLEVRSGQSRVCSVLCLRQQARRSVLLAVRLRPAGLRCSLSANPSSK